jgi:hypothetical protein
VSQREAHLTLHRRTDTGWVAEDARAGQTIDLVSLAASVIVDDVYRDGLEDSK